MVLWKYMHRGQNSTKWLALLSITLVIILFGSKGYIVFRGNLDNRSAAANILSGALDSDESQFASPYLLGLLALRSGKASHAIEYFQAISTDENWFARRGLALALEKNDSWREAISVLGQSLPTDVELRNEIVLRHWIEMDVAERRGHLAFTIESNPSNLEVFASMLLTIQQYADAELWAETALGISPTANAYTTLGASRFYLGDFTRSEYALAEAYELLPDGLTAYWYGRVLAERGNASAAVPILEKLVAASNPLDPVTPWYIRELSVSYALSGQCEQARSAFDKLHSHSTLESEGFNISETRTRIQSLCP